MSAHRALTVWRLAVVVSATALGSAAAPLEVPYGGGCCLQSAEESCDECAKWAEDWCGLSAENCAKCQPRNGKWTEWCANDAAFATDDAQTAWATDVPPPGFGALRAFGTDVPPPAFSLLPGFATDVPTASGADVLLRAFVKHRPLEALATEDPPLATDEPPLAAEPSPLATEVPTAFGTSADEHVDGGDGPAAIFDADATAAFGAWAADFNLALAAFYNAKCTSTASLEGFYRQDATAFSNDGVASGRAAIADAHRATCEALREDTAALGAREYLVEAKTSTAWADANAAGDFGARVLSVFVDGIVVQERKAFVNMLAVKDGGGYEIAHEDVFDVPEAPEPQELAPTAAPHGAMYEIAHEDVFDVPMYDP
ncbi:hypothetical protein M885DRAFT_556560 [Pelagophyceae sp. CCMP2097]|nr:hypothetical protein M885DRAFT_556560 [Pelagophyceae sp. CCMP2097]